MADVYLDNTKRKKIVMFWIPVCLLFLHVWATAFVVAVTVFDRKNENIADMFSSCGWGISMLILLLVSDKALEFLISRVAGVAAGQVIEKTTTETTKVTPAATSTESVEIKAENVNVTGGSP